MNNNPRSQAHRVSPISAGWIKGIEAAARYAGVSEKIASRWIKAGHLRPRVLSRRLHLFLPKDIDHAVELAAQNFDDAKLPREEDM